LALNTPSLNLFGPSIGLVVRVIVLACSSRSRDRGDVQFSPFRPWDRLERGMNTLAISHRERAPSKGELRVVRIASLLPIAVLAEAEDVDRDRREDRFLRAARYPSQRTWLATDPLSSIVITLMSAYL
jgi:hypothetical protein